MIIKKILLFLVAFFIGCTNDNSYNRTNFNDVKYEKCELLLDLKWGEPYLYKHNRKANEIFVKTDKDYKENFQKYYFSWVSVYKGDMAFAFYDKCKDKEVLLQEYVEKFLMSVDGFPEYEIKPVLKGKSYSTIKA